MQVCQIETLPTVFRTILPISHFKTRVVMAELCIYLHEGTRTMFRFSLIYSVLCTTVKKKKKHIVLLGSTYFTKQEAYLAQPGTMPSHT